MADKTLRSAVKDVADAIRSKTGKNGLMTIEEMPDEIESIETGITPSGTFEITANGEYDITDYASVDVDVASSGPDENGWYHLEDGEWVDTIWPMGEDYSSYAFQLPDSGSAEPLALQELEEGKTYKLNNADVNKVFYNEGEHYGEYALVEAENHYNENYFEQGFYSIVGSEGRGIVLYDEDLPSDYLPKYVFPSLPEYSGDSVTFIYGDSQYTITKD